jgi:ubiquinone/menaquinone biosynthesis C-methylase UbiE
MESAGRTLLAAKRFVEAAEAHLVPRSLSSRFTSASAESVKRLENALREQGIDPTVHEPTAASRLRRDRVAVIPWLDRTRPLRSSRILEVGCGRGASTVALAEQGAELIALDRSAGALAIAEIRSSGHGLPVEFLEGDAAELDRVLGERSVDWIIFWASLEHMTVPERLDALAAAWRTLPGGGILTLVETPNRLWFMDSHTSYLPYFNWLPDDLARRYSQFSPREVVRRLHAETPERGLRDLLRSGRGVSFHEFDLAIGPAPGLDVVSCLQLERRQRNPLRRAGWRLSRVGRYESILRAISPTLPRAFLQPFLYLSIRKP